MELVENIAVGVVIAVLAAAGSVILHRHRSLRALLSVTARLRGDDVSGDWDVTGYDIKVPKEGVLYTTPLTYTGKANIAAGRMKVSVTGRLDARPRVKPISSPPTNLEAGPVPSDGDEPTESWNLKGSGFRDGDHLLIVYRLSNRRYAPTMGCIFVHFDWTRAVADGFFLAKRALPDEKLNVRGIAIGRATFRRSTLPSATDTKG